MMTLQEIKRAIDQLSSDERAELRTYIDQQPISPAKTLSAEERIRRLDAAAKAIREGLSEAEWAEIEAAMNEEYIEPWDEEEWKD